MALHGRTHGAFGTKEYWSWRAMLQRCRNPKNPNYKRYGSRGITVCDRWLKFENFIADMGMAPEGKKISVERVDNEGNYEPSNCVWATPKQQAQNRRRNPMYKLTKEQVEEIRQLYKAGKKQPGIAKQFGVTQSHVSRILSGELWQSNTNKKGT